MPVLGRIKRPQEGSMSRDGEAEHEDGDAELVLPKVCRVRDDVTASSSTPGNASQGKDNAISRGPSLPA